MINKNFIRFLSIMVLLGFSPFFLSLFHLNLLTEIFILGIFALSLNILVGYTGLVSLGHAAFFGTGAYASGIIAKEVSANFFVTILLAIVASVLISALIGIFCMRVSGFYFLMLTLAFSQMIYSIIHQSTNVTGGSNGLSGIPSPVIGSMNFSNPVMLFYLILFLFILVFIGLSLVVRSPFGKVLMGIRENETRMKSIGYHTTLYKYFAFVIAGGLGGVAGSLYTNFNGFISPSDVYWTMSGSVLIMVIIGGTGTMLGPILGAAFIVGLETIISSYTNSWMMIIGVIFILFVIFFPTGIVGIWNGLVQKLRKNQQIRVEKRSPTFVKQNAKN